jgi:hypothetical protein
VLAGIRAGGINLHRLPKRVFKTLSGCDGSGILQFVHLPLRGQRRLGLPIWLALLLPVELRHVNHVASTNDTDFSGVFPKSHFFLAQM